MENEKWDKMISTSNDFFHTNSMMSMEMYYDLSLLRMNHKNCFDENILRPQVDVFGHITTVQAYNLNYNVISLEVVSYHNSMLHDSSPQYQNMVSCYSGYISVKETCSAIVVVKDTERSSMAVLSQVLVNVDKKNLGDQYVKYEKRILAYIISLGIKQSIAEDLTQNVFVKSCYNYANGQEIKYFEGYLFGLARNIVHVYRRKVNLLPTESFLSDIENLGAQSTIEQYDVCEEKTKVYKAMAGLPDKYSKALKLRYIQRVLAYNSVLF